MSYWPGWVVAGLSLAAAGLVACADAGGDSAVTLPPEDTALPRDTAGEELPFDTAFQGPTDEVPEHTLVIRQWGTWTLSPAGGPYTELVGELLVQEYPDNRRPPVPDTGDTGAVEPAPDTADTGLVEDPLVLTCDLVFGVVGLASEVRCPGCDWGVEVQYNLVSGDPSGCHDPELPSDGTTWWFAWDGAALQRDVGAVGLWVPWYGGELDEDVLTYEWEVSVAVQVDEEAR